MSSLEGERWMEATRGARGKQRRGEEEEEKKWVLRGVSKSEEEELRSVFRAMQRTQR